MEHLKGKHYYSMAQYGKERFGKRIVKIPLYSGFSCPNRDGSKGVGGCVFCSAKGSGEFEKESHIPFSQQFKSGVENLTKWEDSVYFGYLQSFSNTHCTASELYDMLKEIAQIQEIKGLRIATRGDCLDKEKVAILSEFNKHFPIEIELGLQTTNDITASKVNRCHSFNEFCKGFALVKEANLYICIHIINGLPQESFEDMLTTAKQVAQLKPSGVKIHMLNILKSSPLGKSFLENPFTLLTQEEYVNIVCAQLAVLPINTVIERLTGDAPKEDLIAPSWTPFKRNTLNAINHQLAKEKIYQGCNYLKTEE